MYYKIVLGIVLLIFSSNLFGQVTYGVKAGVNFPSMRVYQPEYIMDGEEVIGIDEDNHEKMKGKYITTFYLSGFSSIKLNNRFALEPGLTLEGRGGEILDAEYKANFMFIGIPLHLSYYIPIHNQSDIIFSAGGYYGLNFGGEIDFVSGYEDNGDSILSNDEITYGKGEEFRRDDYGLNFGISYKLANGLSLHTNYTIGLRNHGNYKGEKVHSRGLSIGLGYQI